MPLSLKQKSARNPNHCAPCFKLCCQLPFFACDFKGPDGYFLYLPEEAQNALQSRTDEQINQRKKDCRQCCHDKHHHRCQHYFPAGGPNHL